MATLFQTEERHRGLLVLQVPVPTMLGPYRLIMLTLIQRTRVYVTTT